MRSCSRNILIVSAVLLGFLMADAPCFALEETGGIGLTIAQLYDETSQDHRGYIVVLDVFQDSPAANGGLQPGDLITHIDDRITKARNLEDILKNDIRGAEETDIHLRIWRSSVKKRLEIKLTRAPMIY